jgi:hypothetical protein
MANRKPWFRWYVAGCWDTKVRRLTPEQKWLWIVVLSLARESSTPGQLILSNGEPCVIFDLADWAGMDEAATEKGINRMLELGMVGRDPLSMNCLYVPAWDERQFESDSSTERVRKHRERASNVSGTLPYDSVSARSKKEEVSSESLEPKLTPEELRERREQALTDARHTTAEIVELDSRRETGT